MTRSKAAYKDKYGREQVFGGRTKTCTKVSEALAEDLTWVMCSIDSMTEDPVTAFGFLNYSGTDTLICRLGYFSGILHG